jgi:hypothetical protein
MAVVSMAGCPLASAAGPPSLVTHSPFLPPGFQPPGQSAAPGQAQPPPQRGTYEFRGVYQLDGAFYFHLYNLREQKGKWLTLDGSREDSVEILEFDPDNNELALRIDGESQNLSLIQTSDRSLPVQTAPTPARVTQPAPGTAPGAANIPVRRRVIRPTTRTGENPSPVIRRPVVNPNPSNP